MSVRIARWIRGYSRTDDKVAVECALAEQWDLRRLQALFGVPEDNLLVDSFPIGPHAAAALSSGFHATIDLNAYHFFLEAKAAEQP